MTASKTTLEKANEFASKLHGSPVQLWLVQAAKFADSLTAELQKENARLREALRGLLHLTDQGREGGLILSRADHKPLTNGDQDIIDRAYIAAELAVLSDKKTAKEKYDTHIQTDACVDWAALSKEKAK